MRAQGSLSLSQFLRRACLGAMAAVISSLFVSVFGGASGVGLVPRIFVGIVYSIMMTPDPGAYMDQAMTAGALGFPIWGLLLPFRSPGAMQWTAETMRADFPALVAWVFFGVVLGTLLQALTQLTERVLGPEKMVISSPIKIRKRVVILGGGFAGMKTAEHLEGHFAGDTSISITLISETNALLFTPMLAEVAGSSLEPSHISAPLRSSLRQTDFVRGRITGIDLEQRTVALDNMDGDTERHLEYDYLVLALGAVSNYLGMKEVERISFSFKSLLDAIRIRNHTIEMFERADRETDSRVRSRHLTFVIAGGGFAGVELAGALNDFARGILADYRNVQRHELQVILVHSRDRILPELTETLAEYARKRMEERGVLFRLNARVKDAAPGAIEVSDGTIYSNTLIWTAGTAPNPLLNSLPLEKDKRGAVIVDHTLTVLNRPGVWALGDCAAASDAKNGKQCPPTAQFALREARTVAKNISALVSGHSQKPFHFNSLGSLCVVGHQTACAELAVPFTRSGILQFSGLSAWLLWRGIYLSKLPGLERKIRVLMNWTLELFFPRDIVQTIDLG
jgi:NADH dehydrogenase